MLLCVAILPALGDDTLSNIQLQFRQAITEGCEAFDARDFEKAKAKAAEADKLRPNSSVTLNLQGAIAIELGNYDEAVKYLEHALEINPRYSLSRLNLAEVLFRQKKYAEARARLEPLLAENLTNELIQYRIFLCWLLEKDELAAKKELEKIKYPGKSPAYYHAQAAWAFYHGNKEEAEKWLKAVADLYPAPKNQIYADSLEQAGWLPKTH